ncbi:hypothetical protein [Candidatus Methanodesulfokora washburnensis]|nr:hypothetical protein [Candidatus Methanodesulfokores washburnensis]
MRMKKLGMWCAVLLLFELATIITGPLFFLRGVAMYCSMKGHVACASVATIGSSLLLGFGGAYAGAKTAALAAVAKVTILTVAKAIGPWGWALLIGGAILA